MKRTAIGYCPHCRATRTLFIREHRRKHPNKKNTLRTRFYHCETCLQFVFSENLPLRKTRIVKEETHYGFGTHRP